SARARGLGARWGRPAARRAGRSCPRRASPARLQLRRHRARGPRGRQARSRQAASLSAATSRRGQLLFAARDRAPVSSTGSGARDRPSGVHWTAAMLKLSLPPAAYELTLSEEAGSPWTVTRVFVSEGLNRSYRAVVDAETDVEADTDALLGCDASLRMLRGMQEQRAVCGVVARVDYLGSVDGHTIVRFEIVPAFELLRQRVDSRIWQSATVQAIVGEVLDPGLGGYGRSLDPGSVARGKAPRDYCTQYRESDFDYVSRLLEEEGISYEYLHDSESLLETLSLRDANDQYGQLENLDGTPDVPIIPTQPDQADVE